MTNAISADEPNPDGIDRRTRIGRRAAKLLVTFYFLINVVFLLYVLFQFFVEKEYGNGLHALCFVIVLATTTALWRSTALLWAGRARDGAIMFFAAIVISMVGNLVVELVVQ